MQVQNNIFVSLDEFEKMQKDNDCKVEYNNGEILLSSNSSRKHNKIIRKILQGIGSFFDNSKCDYYNEQIEIILKNDIIVAEFESSEDVAKFIGCSNSNVRHVLSGKQKTAKGYIIKHFKEYYNLLK